jgi:hypothetical protein
MAENLGSKFATMSEEERRRFALEQDQGGEMAFDDPRRDHARTKADLEDRDGTGAQVDDRKHAEGVRAEGVRKEVRSRGRKQPRRPK